jgi:hypothetical protein
MQDLGNTKDQLQVFSPPILTDKSNSQRSYRFWASHVSEARWLVTDIRASRYHMNLSGVHLISLCDGARCPAAHANDSLARSKLAPFSRHCFGNNPLPDPNTRYPPILLEYLRHRCIEVIGDRLARAFQRWEQGKVTNDFRCLIPVVDLGHELPQKWSTVLKSPKLPMAQKIPDVPNDSMIAEPFRRKPPTLLEETPSFSCLEKEKGRAAPGMNRGRITDAGQDADARLSPLEFNGEAPPKSIASHLAAQRSIE